MQKSGFLEVSCRNPDVVKKPALLEPPHVLPICLGRVRFNPRTGMRRKLRSRITDLPESFDLKPYIRSKVWVEVISDAILGMCKDDQDQTLTVSENIADFLSGDGGTPVTFFSEGK